MKQARTPKRKKKNLVLRDGVYYYRRMVNGKRICTTTGQRDQRLAEIKATEMDAAVNRGEVEKFIGKVTKEVKPAAPGFRAIATDYLNVVMAGKSRQRRSNATSMLQRAITFFGDTPVDAVTVDDCERFLASMLAERFDNQTAPKANSVRGWHALTKQMFERAVKQGFIATNPFSNTDKTMLPGEEAKGRTISPEDQDKFEAVADPEIRRAFRVLMGTGIRREELVLIEGPMIDLFNHVLRLPKHIVKGKKKGRVIPIKPVVEEALVEQMRAREAGNTMDCRRFQFAARRERGGARLWNVSLTTITRWFQTTSEAAGLAVIEGASARRSFAITPHDCRRTFGTRCAKAGVAMSVLQLWMGHSDIKITAKFYVHLDEADSLQAMHVIDIGTGAPKVVPFAKKEEAGQG